MLWKYQEQNQHNQTNVWKKPATDVEKERAIKLEDCDKH